MMTETQQALAALANKAIQEKEEATAQQETLLRRLENMQAMIEALQTKGGGDGGGRQRTTQPASVATEAKYTPKKDNGNYCWTHGFVVGKDHTSETCTHRAPGHKKEATRENTMGGSTAGKAEIEAL